MVFCKTSLINPGVASSWDTRAESKLTTPDTWAAARLVPNTAFVVSLLLLAVVSPCCGW